MTSTPEPSTAADAARPSSIKELADALYAECLRRLGDDNKQFYQDDLLGMNVIPNRDVDRLSACINLLTSKGLLTLMSRDGRSCWKVKKREDAAKFAPPPSVC